LSVYIYNQIGGTKSQILYTLLPALMSSQKK